MGKLPEDSKHPFAGHPLGDLMKSMNDFFHERPIKGLLQSMDEFFQSPFPFGGFPIELDETENEHIVVASLPGVNKEQIQIDVFQNYLTITVQNMELVQQENDQKEVIQRRRTMRKSTRTIPLTSYIDPKTIRASYQNGQLKIRIPKEKGTSIRIADE
jgi:HSP20 family protein